MGALTAVLNEIWAADIPVAEKRRLCARSAAALLMGPTAGPGDREAAEVGTAIEHFEELLVEVGELAGTSKPSVSQAKEVLRSYGTEGMRLASRLGRFSRFRNGRAHPDVSLLRDIGALRRRGAATEDKEVVLPMPAKDAPHAKCGKEPSDPEVGSKSGDGAEWGVKEYSESEVGTQSGDGADERGAKISENEGGSSGGVGADECVGENFEFEVGLLSNEGTDESVKENSENLGPMRGNGADERGEEISKSEVGSKSGDGAHERVEENSESEVGSKSGNGADECEREL